MPYYATTDWGNWVTVPGARHLRGCDYNYQAWGQMKWLRQGKTVTIDMDGNCQVWYEAFPDAGTDVQVRFRAASASYVNVEYTPY